ncbi:MAG: UDP-N-acetylglucosamine 2-epimerase (non-hydrolyzing) [Firmicutes bacterium]|nr:UDP-N-acetylglucosamine 2-epimerase (non-hydrolyzing) [Bacillota bacterium]
MEHPLRLLGLPPGHGQGTAGAGADFRPLPVACVFGTRPEAIKMAPVVSELQRHPELFRCQVVVTAQHRQMLDQVLDLFQIRPDVDLDIMQPGQGLSDVVVRALPGLERAFRQLRPALVLVHGDTTTAFVAALAAFYQQIPVGHVEAGLRSHDRYQPFPEEINRRLISVLADLHFAPTAVARRTLEQENQDPRRIFVTGNTVIDALLRVVQMPVQWRQARLKSLPPLGKDGRTLADGRRLVLVTAHRRENHGLPLRRICRSLKALASRHPDLLIVYPVHPSPQVRQPVYEELAGIPAIWLLEPVEYEEMAHLMARSYLLLTDSGGLQEEGPALHRPVLVMREVTERPEGLQAGTLRLVGTDPERIQAEVERLLEDPAAYEAMARAANPYGDGRAAQRIIQSVCYAFGLAGQRPADFS